MSGVRRIVVVVTSVAALGALAPSASAAMTIGSVQPATTVNCAAPHGMVQTTPSVGETYVAPSDGVITSWTFWGPGNPPATQTKLFVLESVGGADYRIMAVSQSESAVELVQTRSTRLPISAGQTIGGYGYMCLTTPATPGMTGRFTGPEPPVGATQTFPIADAGRMLLQATIEPDADRDGFGDETQDQCPNEPSLQQEPCDRTAPEASITKGPKDKTKKKAATFEFTASEPGSAFTCVLDGKQEFKSCTTPLTIKVKRGKHTLSVTATDPTGNSDPTPATDSWKVKRKKKKKD